MGILNWAEQWCPAEGGVSFWRCPLIVVSVCTLCTVCTYVFAYIQYVHMQWQMYSVCMYACCVVQGSVH